MPRGALLPIAFTDHGRYERELRDVFERSWVHVADTTDVPEPGCYVPGSVGRTPVLIMRGQDGVIRGFLNACPHRGATIAEARGRCEKQIRCPYHGWSFDSCGAVKGVPFREEIDGARDLIGVRTAVLGPMIFACLDDAAPSFEVWAGQLPAAFAATGIERWELAFEKDYEVRVNWKVYVENGLEGYHIPFVHDVLRDLVNLTSGENTLEAHGSYTTVSVSPMLAPPGEPVPQLRFGHLFPNLIPVLSPADFTYLRIDPTGPETVRVHGRGFDGGIRPDVPTVPREFRAAAFDQTNQQDIAVVERVQRGVHARGLPVAVHAELREARVTHFEHMVERALG